MRPSKGLLFLLFALLGVLPLRQTAAQPFTFTYLKPTAPFVNYGDATFGDIDGDGRMDLIVIGNTGPGPPFVPTSYVALTGAEARDSFSGLWGIDFNVTTLPVGLWHGASALYDFDGDGDLDALVTGASNAGYPYTGATVLLINDGATLSPSSDVLPGLFGSAAAWGDYDGDGDADLLLIGAESTNVFRTVLLANQGTGFVEVPTALPDIAYGDIAWADFDGDGDQDILMSGAGSGGSFVTDIFRNTDGEFEALQAGFAQPAFSSVDWGDVDGDGDPDVLLSGGRISPVIFDGLLAVYRNDGSSFTKFADLPPNFYGDARWGDYDSDGDPDIVAAGSRGAVGPKAVRVFQNQGDNTFAERTYLTGVSFASADFADYDGDLDQDILVSGLDREGARILGLYRNDHRIPNTAPTTPTNLAATTVDGVTTLSWDASTDEQSTAGYLTYNVRVGSTPGASNIVSPSTAAGTSRRLYSGRGNASESTTMKLRLPQGSYFWSVQAIDVSYAASAFAAEQALSVTGKGTANENEEPGNGRFFLGEAYPNPARRGVSIEYALGPDFSRSGATITVFNAIGAVIAREPMLSTRSEGTWTWDGRDETGARVASGVYFIRLSAETETASTTVILVK